jgi:hypothetical protein
MAEHRVKTETEMQGPFPQSVIIPRDAFKGLKGNVAVRVDGEGLHYKIESLQGDRSGKLIDGRFPDVDKVWPRTVSLKPGHYDPAYIARLDKAAALLGGRRHKVYPRLFQNGTDAAAMFRVTQQFIGLIMPLRMGEADLPDWCPSKVETDAVHEGAQEALVALIDLESCVRAGVMPGRDDVVMKNARAAITNSGGDPADRAREAA